MGIGLSGLTPEAFISGALEANPLTYGESLADDLEVALREEVERGDYGFLAAVFRTLLAIAEDRRTDVVGNAARMYRNGRERASAALQAVLGALNSAAQQRPDIGRFLAALVERFRDLLRKLAAKLGAIGFSIGVGGFPVTVSLALNFDIKLSK